MSAAVGSTSSSSSSPHHHHHHHHHHHRFSSVLDTMARPGGGWSQESSGKQRDMDYNRYQNHPAFRSQQQRSSNPRQHDAPTSLFAASPTSSSSASAFSSAPSYHHHQQHYASLSPISRDPPYNSSGRPPQPYSRDYATPSSPVKQAAPLLLPLHPPSVDEQGQQDILLRRWPDFRSSPDQSPTTSEPPEDVPFSQQQYSGSGKSVAQAYQYNHQPSRQLPARDESRPPPIKGGLMGKLIPATYSPNGRHPRTAPQPPPPSASTAVAPPQRPVLRYSPQTGSQQSNPSSPQDSQQQGEDRFPPRMVPYHHEQLQRQAHRQQHSVSPPIDYTFRKSKQPAVNSASNSSSVSPRQETKRMSIHSLLAGGDHDNDNSISSSSNSSRNNGKARASTATSIASPNPMAPPAMPSPAPSFSTSEYHLSVRQQPVAARSCGFGERDRRVIDPPPIVQMTIEDPSATPDQLLARLRHPFSVVHCSIYNETGEEDNSAMPEDYRQQRRLMGTLVASPFVGKDENGEDGCFFCFPDLSCRTPGSFRLKFSLVVINPTDMREKIRTPIAATAMSDVLIVYNAKDFPGMQASTALTRKLKEQGCLISIKKGNEKGGGSGGSKDHYNPSDDEYDDDGAAGGSKSGKRKRQRRD